MDQFFLQLSELSRAGWSFEITPEPTGVTLPAVRAAVIWTFHLESMTDVFDKPAVYPLIDWINLFAPEIELRKTVAEMHARVFPFPPFGALALPEE